MTNRTVRRGRGSGLGGSCGRFVPGPESLTRKRSLSERVLKFVRWLSEAVDRGQDAGFRRARRSIVPINYDCIVISKHVLIAFATFCRARRPLFFFEGSRRPLAVATSSILIEGRREGASLTGRWRGR